MVDGEGYAEALLISFAAMVGGVAAMVHGFRRRRQKNLIQETPTEEVESLSVGPSEVKGSATPHPDHGTITAPFSDDDCLVAEWEIEEYESDDDGGHWYTVASGVESVPFHLDDGTGELLVDPHEDAVFDVDETAEPTISVDATESPPPAIRQFVRSDPSVGHSDEPLMNLIDVGSTEGDRRYYHHLIRPGESVYTYGRVEPREGVSSPDNAENLVLKKTPEEDEDLEPMFMISDRSEGELVADRRWDVFWVPGGAVISTVGLAGLVVLTSPVVAVGILAVTALVGAGAFLAGLDPFEWVIDAVT